MSYRNIDMDNEQKLARFLDTRFYIQPDFSSAVRIVDYNEQMKGKDIIVSSVKYGLENAIIDEKNTAHYVNKDIPTFAFELSFLLNNGQEVEGWLTDPGKETEYYLLIYPFATLANSPARIPVFDKITRIRYILIKRESILKLLLDKGFNRDALLSKAREMRNIVKCKEDNERIKATDKSSYGFYFYYTFYLTEKPVNVVIPRHQLETIAITSGFCSAD